LKQELIPLLPELRSAAKAEPLGMYLHYPFCRARCGYCSFASTQDRRLQGPILERLLRELAEWGEALDRPAVDTLYLGGGTPSLLSLEELAGIRKALDAFDLNPLLEASVEANPGTVDAAWFQGTRRLGWDRLSLGIQTLDDELLERLGRIHSAQEGLQAIREAREAGFQRISADLMVGIPGQDSRRILRDARSLVEAGVEHLSVYLLDLDKDCILKGDVDAGLLHLPSEDEVADVFEALQEELPRLGLPPYEISNYARLGCESRHNSRYWERRPYLGLGPSAASQLGRQRWTEADSPRAWAEGAGLAECQSLSPEEALAELPLLGLRMHRGVDWEGLRSQAQAQGLLPQVEAWERALEPCFRAGLVERLDRLLRLTPKGMLLSNAVLEIFV